MGKEKLEHYVEFYLSPLPSSSYAIMEVSNAMTSTKRIKNQDLSKIRIPEETFGYRFFDRREYASNGGEVLTGRKINQSTTYFFGKMITFENVATEVPNSDILISIMKEKGYARMVKTIRGNFQPLQEGDVVLT